MADASENGAAVFEDEWELVDSLSFIWALFLLVLGLIFEASGFGILVVGRLEGLIFVIVGATLFWGGWIISKAQGSWCAVAAVLNMIDAASTVSFWAFEVNPIVLAAGPALFMGAKVVCSVCIALYARIHPAPRQGGIILTGFFTVVVGWNLSQHFLAYLGVTSIDLGFMIGVVLSFAASVAILYFLLARTRLVIRHRRR